MEEINKINGYTQKEKIILSLAGIIFVGLAAASVYWVKSKINLPREEKKVSISSLVDETKSKNENESAEEAQEEAVAEKETPEPIPEENVIKKEGIDIKILNGGTTSGTATKVRDLLLAQGYSKIEAANAKQSNYKAVTIYYKEEFSEQLPEIKDIMKTTYGIIETKEGTNEKEIKGDIVIILGK